MFNIVVQGIYLNNVIHPRMKKVVISENQLEKVITHMNSLFDKRLSPVEGWQNVGHDIRRNSERSGNGYYKGETFIHTPEGDGYFNYYTCQGVENWEMEDVECPCLLLQENDYDFFDKRFPPDLWKPLLLEWWNHHCEYPAKAVYKF